MRQRGGNYGVPPLPSLPPSLFLSGVEGTERSGAAGPLSLI